MEYGLLLMYFVGVRRGVYKPIYPIFIIGDDPIRHEFTLWFSRSEIGRDTSTLTVPEKRCVVQEMRRRCTSQFFENRF